MYLILISFLKTDNLCIMQEMNPAIPNEIDVGTELFSLDCIQNMNNGPTMLVIRDWAMDRTNDNKVNSFSLK
jgi:hypothetical protein